MFMLHHVTPPPWWHPFRRGGFVRCTIWWIQQAIVVSLAKLTVSPVLINQTQIQELERVSPGLRAIPDFGIIPSVRTGSKDGTQEDSNERWDACYVGRTSPSKGVNDLLNVWAKLGSGEKGPRLALLVSTSSEYQLSRIRSTIARKKLASLVRVMPNLSNGRKRTIMSMSRLLVLPSYEEGWSLTAMEAASLGVPIICYDLPAYDYIRDWCITVPAGDRSRLKSAIEAFLKGTGRPADGSGTDRRDQLSEILAQYNARTLVDQQLAVLDSI